MGEEEGFDLVAAVRYPTTAVVFCEKGRVSVQAPGRWLRARWGLFCG